MRGKCLVLFFLFACASCLAQFDRQNVLAKGLLLLDIRTVDNEEPICEFVYSPPGAMGTSTANATKVPGRLLMMRQHGVKVDTLYDSGEYVEKQSGMKIKIRGNTSASEYRSVQKYPFKISLQKKADLLCRGEERYMDKDWVLINTANKFGNDVGRCLSALMGMPYTPAFEYVNVFVNDKYRGVYLLSENVKRNKDCRIDIDKDTGYIIEHDAYWWNEDLSFGESFLPKYKYTFKYPDSEDVTPGLLQYIADAVGGMEQSIASGTYEDYIDVESVARWLLAEDILGSWDGGGVNLFLVKADDTPNTKFTTPCLWDYDSSFEIGDNNWSNLRGRFLFNDLLSSPNRTFAKAYKEHWLANGERCCSEIRRYISDFRSSDRFSAIRQSILLEEAWYESLGVNYLAGRFDMWLNVAEKWFIDRPRWMTSQIGGIETESGVCEVSDADAKETPFEWYDVDGRRFETVVSNGVRINRNGLKVSLANSCR